MMTYTELAQSVMDYGDARMQDHWRNGWTDYASVTLPIWTEMQAMRSEINALKASKARLSGALMADRLY